MTTFKGLIPSLGELIQGHSDHNSTAFKPLTCITTETMAAPERMVCLSEITAKHLPKDKDLRASIPVINTPVNSGGTDTSFWDLREALVPLLPPTSTPPVFRLSCPQVLISENSPSVFKPLTFAQAEAIAEKLCRYPSWDDFCCSFQAAENTGEENKKGGCPCFMAWTNTGGEDKNLLSPLLSSTP